MALVLVTGANGFLGSHICEKLLEAGFEVRALVRQTSDLSNLKGLSIGLVYGDLSDSPSLPAAVEGVDIIVNNAGLTKTNDITKYRAINVVGTENILKAIGRANPELARFIHISSTAACGPAPSPSPVTEDYPQTPLTAYGRSKLEAELIVKSYKEKLAAKSIILRPSAVYGQRDKDMLGEFKAVNLGIKPAFGCGENYVNYTYVKDIAQAVVLAAKANVISGSIYTVAEKRSYSYSETGDIISRLLRKRAFDLFIPMPLLTIIGSASEILAHWSGKPTILTREKTIEMRQKYWLFDTSKIENELGFVATDFETGAAETIAWYKEKGWL